jgi:hypothetical protein
VEFLVYGAFAVVALAAALLKLAVTGRRRQALFELATRFGLEYSPTDPFGLIDHRFDLFNRADAAKCENVVWGNWHGAEVKTGELRFKPDPDRQRTDFHQTAKRYSFAVVEIDAWLPHLAIRHDPLAGVSESLLLDRLRFESDRFNRTYRVDSPDQRFAYKMVDARMMLWLLEMADGFRFDFEVNGDRALICCPRLKPTGLIPLFGAAKGFVDRIPRVVLRDNALSGPQQGHP